MAKGTGKKTGRPSDYTSGLAIKICSELADGRSLKAICLSDTMPDKATVYRWLAAHPEFRDMYARAREDQADTLADEIVDIADNCGADEANKARLQVDARKWVAAKLKPKKYGDKVAIGGADDLPPVKISRIELVALGPRRDDSSG